MLYFAESSFIHHPVGAVQLKGGGYLGTAQGES